MLSELRVDAGTGEELGGGERDVRRSIADNRGNCFSNLLLHPGPLLPLANTSTQVGKRSGQAPPEPGSLSDSLRIHT